MWVATVKNLDWPSSRNLSIDQQKRELLAILDRAKVLNFNAIIFQVRPSADAMYASRTDPWSVFLTGRCGAAPSPGWDPLEFAVEEAHRRGLELHAWFNPYRALMGDESRDLPSNHIARRRPDLVRKYGDMLWLDPGEPEVPEYVLGVVMDVVRRYDIDGVHFDDYFYPYVKRDSKGRAIAFPDSTSYAKYQKGGGRLARDDWRRDNVNRLVKGTHDAIKREKPQVRFGISPFGIWKSGVPPGVKGMSAYSELYADSRLWLASGWVDYLSPQLYWGIGAKEQSFPALLSWWASQAPRGTRVWPGLYTERTGDGSKKGYSRDEIANQIEATRRSGVTDGAIHFSAKCIMRNQGGIADTLARGPYAKPAAVPGGARRGAAAETGIAPRRSLFGRRGAAPSSQPTEAPAAPSVTTAGTTRQ
jgi:uncharacterized lipoprotein YddW (UPF0748 family)